MKESIDVMLGELREFKRMAIGEFAIIRKEIEQLNRFKWTIYAQTGVISTVMVVIIEFIVKRGFE